MSYSLLICFTWCQLAFFSCATVRNSGGNQGASANADSIYSIKMIRREFVPVPGIDANIRQAVATGVPYWGIVQFWNPLENATRSKLAEAEMVPLQFLGGTTYLARFGAGCQLEQVQEFIRWVGPLSEEDKLGNQAFKEEFEEWAITKEGRIKLVVVFFEGASEPFVKALLEKYRVTASPNSLDGSWHIIIEKENILKLAGENAVMWLEAGPNPIGLLID